jgi:hypothetical protein
MRGREQTALLEGRVIRLLNSIYGRPVTKEVAPDACRSKLLPYASLYGRSKLADT